MHEPFIVNAKAGPGIQNTWTAVLDGQPELTLAVPPQFKGPGKAWSPEDLYAQSILNCFIATFKVFAERSQVVFKEIQGQAILEAGKNEAGVFMMKHITLKIQVSGAPNEAKTRETLEKSSAGCMIMSSVNTAKTLELEILP